MFLDADTVVESGSLKFAESATTQLCALEPGSCFWFTLDLEGAAYYYYYYYYYDDWVATFTDDGNNAFVKFVDTDGTVLAAGGAGLNEKVCPDIVGAPSIPGSSSFYPTMSMVPTSLDFVATGPPRRKRFHCSCFWHCTCC